MLTLLKLKDKNVNEFNGVFGESCLSKYFKIPEQIPFDDMHLCLLGLLKWILSQIFSETLSKYPEYYIGIHI